jgi:transcriptional regulator with XRE-family HTH domain
MLEIGSSLREARRRRNIELADVEKATRIRVQQLEALEQERFEQLPPDPYRRSFLREYADFLGLDADLYTSEYDFRFHSPEPRLPAPPPRQRAAPDRRLLAAAGAVAVAALIGFGVWALGRSGGQGASAPRTSLPATTAHATVPTRAAAPQPAHVARTLRLAATRGSCWLLVRVGSSSGPIVYQQTLQAGRTLRLGLRRTLWIRIGAPWNLDATVGRRSLTLPARIGDVMASAAGLRPVP